MKPSLLFAIFFIFYYNQSIGFIKDVDFSSNETKTENNKSTSINKENKCIKTKENYHQLKLTAITEKNHKIKVTDTFWLYNSCEDTLFIIESFNYYKDKFRINQKLIPKQKTALIFETDLIYEEYDFNTKSFNFITKFNDGSFLNFEIIIPVVSYKSIPYLKKDSSLDFSIASHEGSQFSTLVYTYPSGQLRAKGFIEEKDTNLKVGTWLYFEEYSLNSQNKIYSKSIKLSAFEKDRKNTHNRFKVKIKENGIWNEPLADTRNNQTRIFIGSQTDSIIAYTDSTSYAFKINYKKLKEYNDFEFNLLYPNESTLKFKGIETPFSLIKDHYAIELDFESIDFRIRKKSEVIDSFILNLKEDFPEVKKIILNSDKFGLNLELLDLNEKEKVLNKLVNDKRVLLVSQLFSFNRNTDQLNYCDNVLIARIDIANEKKLKRLAKKHGYIEFDIDSGNNNYVMKYPSKLIDIDFFKRFDKFSQEKILMGLFFKIY